MFVYVVFFISTDVCDGNAQDLLGVCDGIESAETLIAETQEGKFRDYLHNPTGYWYANKEDARDFIFITTYGVGQDQMRPNYPANDDYYIIYEMEVYKIKGESK